MYSVGRPTLSNDLQVMNTDTTKIAHSLLGFVTQLRPLQDKLQADNELERFSLALAHALIQLTEVHQQFYKLVRRSREVVSKVQARLTDFEFIIKPGLCDPSIPWNVMKTELASSIRDMNDEEVTVQEIADGFSTLHKDVQETAANCSRLHAALNADLKWQNERHLRQFLDGLKDCALKLPALIPDLLNGIGEDVAISFVLALAPCVLPIVKHSVDFVWNRWCIYKKGSRFHIVQRHKWQEQCANTGGQVRSTHHAWQEIRNEMHSLRNALDEITEERVVPTVDSYVDVIRNLRQSQIIAV